MLPALNKTAGEVAEIVGGRVVGDAGARITSLSGIEHAGEGDLTFLGSPRFASFLETTLATAVFVPAGATGGGQTLIEVDNPYLAFARMLQLFERLARRHPQGVHPTAVIGAKVSLGGNVALDAHVVIADECVIGDNVVIYAHSYIGAQSIIGPDTLIYSNVTVREWTTIGARCILQPGAVIGADGFGFTPVQGRHEKIPQVGRVVLGDDVEIGANTAVDRATCGQTVISKGTKIDNLVQIGHNVRIGEHCTMSGASAVAGSATLGSHVTVAGDVGIGDHVEIGDNVILGARAGVTKSIPAGQVVSGFPAKEHTKEKRIQAALRNLPQLQRRVHELESQIQELELQVHGKAENHS
jgi:UDP-3-O-[3-hydroxymyristoyl] glucosamine N-acyltransferase